MNCRACWHRAVLAAVAWSAGLVASEARAETNLSAASWVRQGNAALAAGRADEALELYKRAEVDLPGAAEIAYNRGVALYRKGRLEEARTAFGDTLRTRDPVLEAHAKYNLGNCAYATALQKLQDLPGAIDELRKALSYYRDSLQLDPGDREARENIERAQLLMKDLLDKEKKRQEEERKKQQQNPQSQPTSQPEQKREDPQQQQRDNQQPQEQEKQEQQKDEQRKQQSGEQQKKKDKGRQPKDAQRQPHGFSKEEAERMLQAVRDKERTRREERQRREALMGAKVPVERDW